MLWLLESRRDVWPVLKVWGGYRAAWGDDGGCKTEPKSLPTEAPLAASLEHPWPDVWPPYKPGPRPRKCSPPVFGEFWLRILSAEKK
jgi:hypothetical protein